MAGVGGRFELEELRREAQAEKKAARIRAIVSNATFVVVIIAVAIGGKIGWDKWQEKREADRAAAEAEQLAAEKREAERKRAEAEREKALAEKRKAEAEQREAERKAREEKREAERLAKEEARMRKEEERKLLEAERAEQQELRKYEDGFVSAMRFQVGDHLCYGYGLDSLVEVSVDEKRWGDLASLAQKRQTIDFLEQLRGSTVTNGFSASRYPDRETFSRLLANLDEERFTLVLRLKDEARGRRLALVAGNLETGLAAPEGSRPLKAESRILGWTVPFAYGDKSPLILLDQSSVDKFVREWTALRRKLRTEAAKLDDRDAFVEYRLKKELPDFLRSVKIEITTPPPEEKPGRKADAKKRETKPRPSMKGSNSDIRTLRGPQRR